MEPNEYVIMVFNYENKNKLLEALEGMGIHVPIEFRKTKIIWDELYIVNIENKTVKRITDYYEKLALIHTGVRSFWPDDFIKEINSGIKKERVWKKLYREDGSVAYEGFTENNRPYGAGRAFYSDGRVYQEGLFGEKGLLSGVEYYDNGQVRFDGILECRLGYGPNYPVFGRCYYRDGKLMYTGKFKVSFSGSLSWPRVDIPKDYGSIASGDRPWF